MSYNNAWSRYLELWDERPECFRNTGPIHIVRDWVVVEKYQQQTGKTIGICYESEFNILVVDLVYEREGEYFSYERIFPAVPRGAVVCIPTYKGRYILLKQYRHAMRDYQFAFPRGYATAGLAGEENACKEAEEELCAEVKHVQFVGNVVADSGMSAEKVGIYLCDLNDYRKHEDYEGIVDTVDVTIEELTRMIHTNQISDGFTLAAYSYLVSADMI